MTQPADDRLPTASGDALHNLCRADPVWAERYEGWHALGHGSSATVVRTRSKATGDELALKVFPQLDAEDWRRYQQEVSNAQRLASPFIVRCYSAFPRGTFAWIEMEWVDGQNLRQEIESRAPAPLPAERVVEIAAAVAQALATAHAEGMIHRDVKPANILLPARGVPIAKLGDFGLSRFADASRLTQTGLLVGTPQFAAPEVIEGEPAGPASDVYAFSLCVYLMLSGGRAPFDLEEGTTLTQWIWAHTHQPPRPIESLVPHVPAVLAELLAGGLDKDPARRPSAAEIGARLAAARPRPGETPKIWSPHRPLARPRRTLVALVGVGLSLAAAAGVWWGRPRPAASAPLTRLTADAGLTLNPALSPDGKLLAYASDRAGEGHLDIWVQQTVGGQPLRLTRDPSDDRTPSFSPDGMKIAFRSERAGGGIYVVPALGGEARLLVPQGHWPRFSPDGGKVACVLGAGRVDNGPSPSGIVAIVPAAGGVPQRFPLVREVTAPIWAPDGKHLLVVGNLDMVDSADDWWVIAVASGKPPVRTGAQATFDRAGLEKLDRAGHPDRFPRPFHWAGRRLLFSATRGDSTNVWQIGLSPETFQVTGSPLRLTMGTEIESEPLLAPDGRLVFSAQRSSVDLWALAADASTAEARGQPRRLTEDPAVEDLPHLSPDGRWLIYTSARLGNPDVWLKDLESGTERALTATAEEEIAPIITRDGRRVFYARYLAPRKLAIEAVAASGQGVPERICEDCGVPISMSRDERWIVLQYRPTWFPVHDASKAVRTTLAVLDRTSGRAAEILTNGNFNLYRGELSPDDKWIAFHGEHQAADTRELIAPFRGSEPVGAEEWITIVNGDSFNCTPQWSPDGNTLYHVSDRDGFRCIWAQRLDPATKRPVGPPVGVYHAHHRRPSLSGVSLGSLGLAVGRDKIVFNMVERWANIWTMGLPP